MRAFRVTSFEMPPALEDVESIHPQEGEVLIKIAACGLNFADLLMSKGTYQDTPAPPFTLGMEVCGTVIACGLGVTVPAIGNRVAVFGGQGGLADEGVFAADRCLVLPDVMPSEVAAGFQIAYGTSHLALTRRARLKAGETLVVLGAAGGVGLTAVEIGKTMGARVIAVAKGADKLEIARAAGADHVVDARDDVKSALKALGGADVVYDPVGGDLFKAVFGATNKEGRIITIGFASGTIPQIPANILLVKNIEVIGFYWGGYMKFAPDVLDASLKELVRWYSEGKLRPHVSHVLPLENAGEALELIASRKSTGKVVVTP